MEVMTLKKYIKKLTTKKDSLDNPETSATHGEHEQTAMSSFLPQVQVSKKSD